jgi:hypothetical protein
MTAEPRILSAARYHTNADLLLACVQLGYLRKEWATIDATYGLGVWWRKWRPDRLYASDLDPELSPAGQAIDFTHHPAADGSVMVWALDGPYKLNGTDTDGSGKRYGVHVPASRKVRHQLIMDGMAEGYRCLAPGGIMLVKCMNQVNGGKRRWQTRIFSDHGERLGMELADQLDFLFNPRPQKSQKTSHQNYSSLLVFRKLTPTQIKARAKQQERETVEWLLRYGPPSRAATRA